MMIAIGLLLLRLILGIIFLLHGAQKLFGLFGGHGLAGTSQFLASLGLRPAKMWAIINALGETLGGLLLFLGLLTPLGALLVIGVMLVAIAKVHWKKGFWNGQGGYEYNLLLTTVAVVLGLLGAGAYSLDAAFGLTFAPQYFLIGLALLIVLLVVGIPAGAWIEQHAGGQQQLRHPSNI